MGDDFSFDEPGTPRPIHPDRGSSFRAWQYVWNNCEIVMILWDTMFHFSGRRAEEVVIGTIPQCEMRTTYATIGEYGYTPLNEGEWR